MLAGLLVAVGCERSAPPEWEDPATIALRKKIDHGKRLFEANCISCHVVGSEPVVREGPDLTYFGAKAKRSGVAVSMLDPAQPPPKAKPDHPKVPGYQDRSAVSLFLSKHCVPDNYARPGADVPRGRQTTCAVTGVRLDMEAPTTERRTHGGKTYYMYDAVSARKFDLNPAHFAK
jgi:YHS domain-containing protein